MAKNKNHKKRIESWYEYIVQKQHIPEEEKKRIIRKYRNKGTEKCHWGKWKKEQNLKWSNKNLTILYS